MDQLNSVNTASNESVPQEKPIAQQTKLKTKKELTPEQLLKQQRKILKDQRRKQFHDISIQGTNDYSIVSKRSVEKLYTANSAKSNIPHYFQHFVKKHARRSPAINRGYWTRMESIKRTSYEIIHQSVKQGMKCVVINLGAGYDPLAFQYLDAKNPDNLDLNGMVRFIDVDYPDLNKIKIDMIRQSEELCQIIGAEEQSKTDKDQTVPGVELHTKNYTVLSCDLKNIDLFTKQLQSLNLDDPQIAKIYIAEVSIAYMLPDHSDAVIKATSQFANSHFLCLEQIMPSGDRHPFARTMLFHFNKLNSPIQTVPKYHSLALQIQRFQKLGYDVTTEAQDLNTFWRCLDDETKKRVWDVESFDEWEEFIVFGQHYLILHASNVQMKLLDQDVPTYKNQGESQPESEPQFKFQIQQTTEERKHQASTILKDNTILTNGGASISRLNTTLTSNPTAFILAHSNEDQPTLQPQARLSHTLTAINENKILLVGGRTAPGRSLTETWTLTKTSTNQWDWNPFIPLPTARSRHCTFVDSKETPYIFGGLSYESTDPAFIKLNSSGDAWEPVAVTGEDIPVMMTSASIAMLGDHGVLIGGMRCEHTGDISSKMYRFVIDCEKGSVHFVSSLENDLLNRFGAHCSFISENQLLVVGGVSELFLHDQQTTIVKVDLSTNEVTPVRIEDSVWSSQTMPLLVGFQMVKLTGQTEKWWCLNGGAVCYSFGSVWNQYFGIEPCEDSDADGLENQLLEFSLVN
ncbi:hypothetical protein WICPIJ_004057 [Wickerhamomyces pijperi]|uniref:tRNA wybutosine-synthesizing protein 4 n=1 Tax=Wickerhamomyces pijperi TaxID=599730 RepID=A0A9P8TMF3_WICPI|nr:hypothetical protein WICPIJ_004057 [Wickerhamomyces pijperi]